MGERAMSDCISDETMSVIVENIRGHTVPKNGICKSDDCNGKIIREVIALFRGKFEFDFPHCERCKRTYIFGSHEHVPKRGQDEFLELMNKPMTI